MHTRTHTLTHFTHYTHTHKRTLSAHRTVFTPGVAEGLRLEYEAHDAVEDVPETKEDDASGGKSLAELMAEMKSM